MRALVVLAFCAVAVPLRAPATFAEETAQAPPPPQEVQLRLGLTSPRATMETFLRGMDTWKDGGWEKALSTLDLSAINPEVRERRGQELAVKLRKILDRHRRVSTDDIRGTSAGEPYVHLADPAGRIVIDLVEDPETGTKAWKFTSSTLDDIDRSLYDEYKNLPLAPDVARDTTPALFSLRLRDWLDEQFPFLLGKAVFLENWQWLGLFAIIVTGMGFSRFIVFLLLLLFRRLFARQAFSLDKRLERDFVRPIRIAFMAWVWLLGLSTLGLPTQTLVVLHITAKTISAVAAVWAVYRLIDILGSFLAEKASGTDTRFDDLLAPLLTRSLKVFVVVFGFVWVADVLDWQYKSVLAGLGLGGLAFALAAKDSISNIFGSLTVLMDRPFQMGDWVRIGDIDGNVETVGIRSTRIRTFYNSLITVPNSELINATVDNMGSRRYRRIKAMLAVTYDTPPEKIEAFCEGIRQLIREHPYTRKDYYHVYLNEFADASLNVLLYCFHEAPDWATELRERHRLFLDIIRLAQRLGVEFAFPTQTLYVRPEHGDGDSGGPAPPGTAEEAFVLGRAEANQIVGETLGKNSSKPPPVRFEAPPGPGAPLGDTQSGLDE